MMKIKLILMLITVLLFGAFAQMALAQGSEEELISNLVKDFEEEVISAFIKNPNTGRPSYVNAIDYDTEIPLSLEAQAALAIIQYNGGDDRSGQHFPLTLNGDITDKEKEYIEMLAKQGDISIIDLPEKDRIHYGVKLTLLNFTKTYTEEDGIDTTTFEALKRSNRDEDAYYFYYARSNPLNGLCTTYKVKLVDGKWELQPQGWIVVTCG